MYKPPTGNALTKIAIKGLKFTHCRYEPYNTPIGGWREVMIRPESLQRLQSELTVSRWKLGTLWWTVRPIPHQIPVPARTRMRTRMAAAFKIAMHKKGYVAPRTNQWLTGRHAWDKPPSNAKNLLGSLEIYALSTGLLTARWETVLKEASLIVDEVEWQTNRHLGQTTEAMKQEAILAAREREARSQQPKGIQPGGLYEALGFVTRHKR